MQRQRHVAEVLDEREVLERAQEMRFAEQSVLHAGGDARGVRSAIERRVQRVDQLIVGFQVFASSPALLFKLPA